MTNTVIISPVVKSCKACLKNKYVYILDRQKKCAAIAKKKTWYSIINEMLQELKRKK